MPKTSLLTPQLWESYKKGAQFRQFIQQQISSSVNYVPNHLSTREYLHEETNTKMPSSHLYSSKIKWLTKYPK